MSSIQDQCLLLAQALREGVEFAIRAPVLVDTAECHEILLEADHESDWETAATNSSLTMQLEALRYLANNRPLVQLQRDEDGGFGADTREMTRLKHSTHMFSHVRTIEKVRSPARKICIGRGKKNDVVVMHRSVSAIHAQVEEDGGSYSLYDSNSSNGTFVNEKRIDSRNGVPLHSGNLIRLGELTFHYLDVDTLRLFLKFRLSEMLAEGW